MALPVFLAKDRLAATVSVKSDGSGDFTTVQAAVDALPASGGSVHMGEGTLSISTTITLPDKPIRFIGAGRGLTVFDLGSNAIAAFTTANDQDLVFENFTIKGDGTAGQKGVEYTKVTVNSKTSRFVNVEVGVSGGAVEQGIVTSVGGFGTAILEDCKFLGNNTAASNFLKADGQVHLRKVQVDDSGIAEASTGSLTMFVLDSDIEINAAFDTVGEIHAVRTTFRGTKHVTAGSRPSSLIDCDIQFAPGATFVQFAFAPNCDESRVIGCRFSGSCERCLSISTGADRVLVSHNDFGTDFISAAIRTEGIDGRFTGNTRCKVVEAGTADKNSYIGIDTGSTTIGPFSKINGAYRAATAPGIGDDINDGVEIGDRWIDTTANKAYVCLDNAAGAADWNQTDSRFGNDYQTAISTGRSTSSSSTFASKVSLTTGAITGTYRVRWTTVMDSEDTTRYQVRLRNTTDGVTLGAERDVEPERPTDRLTESGFGEVVFSGVAKTFQLQFASQDGSSVVGIQDARIELWRVS